MLDVPGVHLGREVATALCQPDRGIPSIRVGDQIFEFLGGEQRLVIGGLRALQPQVFLLPVVGKERLDAERPE
jgi:hypothetical protein